MPLGPSYGLRGIAVPAGFAPKAHSSLVTRAGESVQDGARPVMDATGRDSTGAL